MRTRYRLLAKRLGIVPLLCHQLAFSSLLEFGGYAES